jgi:hypothetical protein
VAKKKRKAGGPNKSAAIREYLKTHPNAGPTEVCKELKKKGLTIAPALVSNVKAAAAGKKIGGRRKPGRPARGSDTVSISALLEAREFVDRVGGVAQAERILKALGKLN